MLHQCEKQAKRLCTIDIDDNYCNEVDIFDNYFSQLKQIIEKEGRNNFQNRVNNLLELMNKFISRMETSKNRIEQEACTIQKNKNMKHYGQDKHISSFRINGRY